MIKILLINPYSTHKRDSREYPAEPLGLLSLTTYLNREIKDKSFEIQTTILDAQLEGPEACTKTDRGFRSGMTDEEIKSFLEAYNPDLVGITNNFTNLTNDVLDLSKTVKQTCPNCCLILGGAHATIDHKNLIKLDEIDAVVRSEGEVTFKEVVFTLYNKTGFENVAGLTWKMQGQIHVNSNRPLIEDINALPIPDRSLIPYKKYLAHSVYISTMNKPVASIFSARGCPFHCIFCSTQKVWGNKWRARSPEKMLEEVEYLIGTYGVHEMAFEDDQFMGDKERIKNFCKLVIDRKLKITFMAAAGISPGLLNREMLELMKKAGFYRICFSIDVGTPAMQRYVRKPVKLEEMRNLVKKANSLGFWTYATFVVGFPNENVDDIKQTIKYAYNLRLDYVVFYLAQPHLGSELYNIYLKEGLIDEEIVQSYHPMNESLFGTKYMSALELEAIRNSAARNYFKHHLKHFRNPIYTIQEFLPKISSYRKLVYSIRLLLQLSGLSQDKSSASLLMNKGVKTK